MKTKFQITYWGIVLVSLVLFSACKKDFLNLPPTDRIVDANFYKSDDQVMAATALLYSSVWFDYNDKASFNLGDFRAGTAYSPYNDRDNVLFRTTGNTPENVAAWRAFFVVVAQSNLAIHNVNTFAGPAVSSGVKNQAIAEARFMRALAYRYLVMNWGPVPIIEDNLTKMTDTTIARNTVKSVWKFITNEMRAAAEDLPPTPSRPGRVTKWSAEGMLARFYLTRAGVESVGGKRKQEYLDSAKYYASRVITQSGHKLLEDYAQLFLYPYDNNSESLFSLQWVYSPDAWGTQNTTPSYLNYSNDIANGDGWGGDKSATWWMMKQYEGFSVQGDEQIKGRTLDQRLKATFMLPGAHYPEITQQVGKATQKLIYPFTGSDNNYVAIKKYVTGKSIDVGGNSASQNYGNDTYMLRLAEMYLILAEATLGDNPSAMGPALDYFNVVHQRAGLPKRIEPLTFDDIFRERIIEFAMEGMAWYDLVSLHYYNPTRAYEILNSQDRGLFYVQPDQMPNPTVWTITKTAWATNDRKINANSGNFYLPIPNIDLNQAPNLKKPEVDYYNK